jgi:hypothetical protein
MSSPHPALLQLAIRGEAGPIADEDAFVASVSEHRMVSNVTAAIDSGAIQLSPEAGVTLGMRDLAEWHRHIGFWKTIRRTEAALEEFGVGAAVIKGVATEARWYDGIGDRVCTDVDLFLDPGALDNAADIVEQLDPKRGSKSAIEWLVIRRLLQHVDLRIGSTQVDLHFDPLKLGVPTVQIDEVWKSTETIETDQGSIRVLRAEIELVLLLLHLNKDRFAFLGSLLDIPRILQRAALDWDYLQEFVAGEGLDVPVWNSLASVAEVLSLTVDIPRPKGFRSLMWQRLWARHRMLGGYEGRQAAPTVQRMLPFHLKNRSSDVAREIRRQVMPPRQLVEVAGQLEADGSYFRYLILDRFRANALP